MDCWKYDRGYLLAKLWSLNELAIINGDKVGPNEYCKFVPVEVVEFCKANRSIEIINKFSDAHFGLWAALAESGGTDTFKKPLGWNHKEVCDFLIGI